jgi:uncharacterized protein with PQ loop repeat
MCSHTNRNSIILGWYSELWYLDDSYNPVILCIYSNKFPSQLITNFRRKDVSGLQPLMILLWVAADCFNLTGAILTGQIFIQILLSSYFFFIDTLLGIQYIYYTIRNRRKQTQAEYSELPQIDDEELSEENIDVESKANRTTVVSSVLIILGISSILLMQGYQPASNSNTVLKFKGRSLLQADIMLPDYEDIDEWPLDGWVSILGYSIGSVSAFMTICSRLPQIIKNVRFLSRC